DLHVPFDPVLADIDMGAGFLELVQHRFEQGGIGVLELYAATGCGCGHQVGTGLDAVGHHAVATATETFDAVDGDGVGTGAGNLRAHRIEEVGQVDHLRLASGVLQHAATVGQGGGHHDVLGTSRADDIEEEVRTAQTAGRRLGLDVAAFDLDLRTHGFQAADMQIDRTRADGTATRQRHFSFAEARDHGAQHQNRSTHGLDQLVGRHQRLDAAGIDFDAELLVDDRLHAHAAEQFDHGGDVVQVRQVA